MDIKLYDYRYKNQQMHAESHSKSLPWARRMNGIMLLIKHLTGLTITGRIHLNHYGSRPVDSDVGLVY